MKLNLSKNYLLRILVFKYNIFNQIIAIEHKSISQESKGYFSTPNIIYNFYEVSLTEKILNEQDIINSILFDCQCALFLLEITNKESLTKLKKLFKEKSFKDFPYLNIILVENKIDENREISEDEVKEFIEQNDIKDNFKISIKDGSGLEELSNKAKEYINDNKNDIPINFSSQNINEYNSDVSNKLDYKGMKTANLIFLGNSMVGKTALFLRYDKNYFKESFMSSIGVDHIIKTFKYKNEIYKVNLCDTAGQDRYRNNLPRKYYINSHGVFLLFDLNDQESFNDVSIWMNEINQKFNTSSGNKKGPVIYLIGNKLDKLDRVITREQAEEKANFYGIKYYEISCKLNINVQEVYSRMVLDCIPNLEEKVNQNVFKVDIKKKPKMSETKKCCYQ